MDIWAFSSDLILIGLVSVAWLWGFLMGKEGREIHTVYVKDDGEGGITAAPEFDPKMPGPGDPLYVPEDWTKYANAVESGG